jgi:hypothetical protein
MLTLYLQPTGLIGRFMSTRPNKFVAAAWRDVGFPTEEQDGRCLEEWLADRVRRDFPEKTPKARKERQELDLELARSRAEMRPSLSE